MGRRKILFQGPTLPKANLLESWLKKNGMIGNIGESSILYQSGDASTWQTTAAWGFERTTDTIAIDTALGGGVLFIGETPRYMTWAAWMNLADINVDYLFIGIKGIAGYSTDQTGNAVKIRRYLNSVDQELFVADIFDGLDTNGFTFANPPVAIDQDGNLRISAEGSLACEGGYFATTLAEGAILGPELITAQANREFSSDTGFWGKDAGVTISDGVVNFNIVIGGGSLFRNNFLTNIYTRYVFSFDLISIESGSVRTLVAGLYGPYYSTPGSYSDELLGIGVNGRVHINASVGTIATIDNISIKEIIPVWIERTPAPSKKTIRTLTGSKTVYADADPTAWKRATVDPTGTNKCTCRKINPTDTTNLTKSGDAAAVLSVVDSTAALAAAGLDKICTSGKVYRADNSDGSTDSNIILSGASGNTNAHSISAYTRKVSGAGASSMRLLSGSGSVSIPAVSSFVLLKSENVTPSNVSQTLIFIIKAGDIVEFILPQLEEGAFCTDPIITAADPLASISRTGTSITKPTAGLFPMVSATEAQNFGIYMRVIPRATGQSAVYSATTRITDGDHTSIRFAANDIRFRKLISSGSAIDVIAPAYAPQAGVPIDILCLQSSEGMAIKIRNFSSGVWSAWSAWSNLVTASGVLPGKVGSELFIGSFNNGQHLYANYPLFSILKLGNRSTLAEYQAVAEVEVNKINA